MPAMQTWAEPATLCSGGTVSTTSVEPVLQPADERVAQDRQAGVLVGPLTIGEVERDRRGDDAGSVVGAAAALAFLAAADDQRIDLRAATFDEHADALRSAELVGAERQQIDVRGDVAQVEPAGGLDRIGVQQASGAWRRTTRATSAMSVIVPTSLLTAITLTIVTSGVASSTAASSSRSTRPNRIDADHPSLLAEVLDDVEHGVVFDGRTDRDAAASGDRSGDRHVVALGAAAGEHHLVRMAADHARDGVAGLVDGLTGLTGETVGARRVGVQLREVRHHRLDGLGAHRRRRSMVEVGDGRLRHLGHATEYSRARPARWLSHRVSDPRCDTGHSLGRVRGYDHRSYGDGFADVYDEWYADVTDVDATVTRIVDLAGGGGRVLELGVGTGRLAVPMAGAGLRVVGIDSSEAMLAKLARARHRRDASTRSSATSPSTSPPGRSTPYWSPTTRSSTCSASRTSRGCSSTSPNDSLPAASSSSRHSCPTPTATDGSSEVTVRSMTVDHVVLSVSVNRPDEQLAEGQFVQFSEGGGVRLRPWSIRWATPEQLDAMAAAAGSAPRDATRRHGRHAVHRRQRPTRLDLPAGGHVR